MKAMILAAGLGTRLRPLTDNRPKALVEIAGRTLLEITLSRLRAFGITEVIINVHHFADRVIDYLKSNKNFGMRIEISREEVLLDTGGGLKKAAWFFLEDSSPNDPSRLDEPFLLHNVDVISTIDFARMLQFHKENCALATLAVQARETSRYLLFDDHLQLRGRRASGTPVPSGAEGATPACLEPRRGRASQTTATPNPSGTASPPAETPVNCHSERSDERPTRGASPESSREESAFSKSQAGRSQPLQALAFSGIHLISARLLPMLTEEGIFSIIDSYLRLAAQAHPILAFRADQYYWRDLGRPADLAQAALDTQL
jgi:NDP-sugar pyrophosphorylase family protein